MNLRILSPALSSPFLFFLHYSSTSIMMIQYTKRAGHFFAPPTKKSADGRDEWPSRTAFLLAAMGGCAGQGNLLRYPSVVYNNYRLQWFVAYPLAVFLIAMPALILEIAIGQ